MEKPRIEEQTRMEDALRESEARWRTLVETAPDAIVTIDHAGIMTTCNEAAARMFGYAREEMLGRNVSLLMPSPHREAHDRYLSEYQRTGLRKVIGFWRELSGRRKDGTECPLEVSVSETHVGGQHSFTGILRDLTERKRVEARLKEQAHLQSFCARIGKHLIESRDLSDMLRGCTQTMVDDLGAAFARVWLLNEQDNVLELQASSGLYTNLDGRHARVPVGSLKIGRIAAERKPNLTNQVIGDPCVLEQEWAQREGMVAFAGYPLVIDDRLIGVMAMFSRDALSESTLNAMALVADQIALGIRHKRAEAALRESEERLRAFSSQLEQLVEERTVELRQSQDRLRGLATELNLAEQRERKRLAVELHDHLQQMLVLGKIKLGQGRKLAASIPACAKVMGETDALLSEALTYTRTLVAELSPPVLRDHGLAAGLKWIGEYMQKHDMAVTVTVMEEPPKLPDEQALLLFQSVRELLMNAWKHAQTKTAEVTMDTQDERLHIEVRDYGQGFHLAAAEAKPSPGLASKFGLFSIRERMRALGGSFTVESIPGQGTTARLTLPLKASGRTAKEAPPPHVSLAVSTQTARLLPDRRTREHVRVLLVDDHAMVRQGLKTMLESYADVQVVGEACHGEEALASVERLRPAVVVMDINMPKLNGIEATARLKSRYPDLIIIGVSVNAEEENQEAMKRAGASMLITKEAAVEQLYAAIQEISCHRASLSHSTQ